MEFSVKFQSNDSNGNFEVWRGNFSQFHGICKDNSATIVGGQVIERPNGPVSVLITLSNGKVGEFAPSHTAGLCQFVRWM
jgi:hypothetical protein